MQDSPTFIIAAVDMTHSALEYSTLHSSNTQVFMQDILKP